MKIGYCVEGSTDRAMVKGLRNRWCHDAELIEGRFRGAFRRREIPKACLELQWKGADVIVLLRDANPNDDPWRQVLKKDKESCSQQLQHMTVFGVCERNVECWLVADPQYAAKQTGKPAREFFVPDPKAVFEHAMGITSRDRKEDEIAKFVLSAPLKNWLKNNKSFKAFYKALREQSARLQCQIENLLDSDSV